mgnify:CR=1 FL=1
MVNIKLTAGLLIFVVSFYFILFGKQPKSLTAIIGGSLMVLIGVMDQEEALESIGRNLEILLLLMGLMMVVEIMSETGIFQWVAIKVAQQAKGEPMKILMMLSVVTAICSAFLDNVTTILLIVPITILLAKKLKIDPFPFIMVQIFACNIGGTATMIGDPPNLIIASLGGLDFNEFLINLTPIVVVNMIVLLITAKFLFGKKFTVSRELRASIMDLEPNRSIKNKKLLMQSCALFGIILIGFLTNIGLAVISITGSVILLTISKKSPEEIYKKVEWETLFFFGGLFVLVEGVDKLGVIAQLGEAIVKFTEGNLEKTGTVVVLISSLLSPILGSVPYTLSFSKIIANIAPNFTGHTDVLWWALSLGACLGGNMTLVGAPANIVGVSIAEKAGVKISFMDFFKLGILIVIQSMILSVIYINLRY